MTNSLRLQLTAWYLAFFTVVLVLFSVFLYGLVSRVLYQRLDDNLTAEIETASGLLQDEIAETAGNLAAAGRETMAEMRLRVMELSIFESGTLVASSAPDSQSIFRELVQRCSQTGQREELNSVLLQGRPYRAFAEPVTLAGHHLIMIAAGTLSPILGDLSLVRRVLFTTLPLVVFIVGIGGFALASRSLRPVRRMAEQAKHISDRDLRRGLDAGAAGEELQVLADSFNELLSRIDRSFDAIRRFVADASHELRTPLAVVRGEADVALTADRSVSEYKESMAIIQDEARRLSRLVDDLLQLARADAENVELRIEPFYFNDLVTECCRVVQPMAHSRNIALDWHCDEDVPFNGDPELLRRLTLNLLDNAIHYTPAGGRVAIDLKLASGGVCMSVSDTGIGIPEEAVPHVFERFYRTDQARSRDHGGFGLGLSIVKSIAESHHGTVELRSRPGLGSTFTVSLRG